MSAYWRPSAVGELVLSLSLMGGALLRDGLLWWVRLIVFAFGFTILMALKGQDR